jgi:rare lipoprotein A
MNGRRSAKSLSAKSLSAKSLSAKSLAIFSLAVFLASVVLMAGRLAVSSASAGETKARGFTGLCAFYSESGRVASGGHFDPNGLTAAHRTLPFGTRVRVTDPKSGRSVIVTVNDRGPFGKGRVIDVSLAAARALGMIDRGIIYVQAEVL